MAAAAMGSLPPQVAGVGLRRAEHAAPGRLLARPGRGRGDLLARDRRQRRRRRRTRRSSSSQAQTGMPAAAKQQVTANLEKVAAAAENGQGSPRPDGAGPAGRERRQRLRPRRPAVPRPQQATSCATEIERHLPRQHRGLVRRGLLRDGARRPARRDPVPLRGTAPRRARWATTSWTAVSAPRRPRRRRRAREPDGR